MMTRPRPFLSLILAAALVVAGVAVASARGQVGSEGTLVAFCSGGGLVQVVVGPDGQPTGDMRICPDLAATALAALDMAQPQPDRPDALSEPAAPPLAVAAASRPVPEPAARGPPSLSA